MPNLTLDYFSLVSIPLFPTFGTINLGVATGFFYRFEGKVFLVSNWHVFSGRRPDNGQPLDTKHGAVPDRLRAHLHTKTTGQFRKGMEIPLKDSEGALLWRQHKNGQDIDVAILEMPPADQSGDINYYCVNEQADQLLSIQVGTDVFIVGFPKGLALQEILPIWKRGTIASEPYIEIGDKPMFLVDTATRDGMSGSPTYARSFGFAALEGGNAAINPGTIFTRFLGVYSGRYGADDELAAQVGRIWRRELIDQIISDGTSGGFLLR